MHRAGGRGGRGRSRGDSATQRSFLTAGDAQLRRAAVVLRSLRSDITEQYRVGVQVAWDARNPYGWIGGYLSPAVTNRLVRLHAQLPAAVQGVTYTVLGRIGKNTTGVALLAIPVALVLAYAPSAAENLTQVLHQLCAAAAATVGSGGGGGSSSSGSGGRIGRLTQGLHRAAVLSASFNEPVAAAFAPFAVAVICCSHRSVAPTTMIKAAARHLFMRGVFAACCFVRAVLAVRQQAAASSAGRAGAGSLGAGMSAPSAASSSSSSSIHYVLFGAALRVAGWAAWLDAMRATFRLLALAAQD